jgi:hypothetical protein
MKTNYDLCDKGWEFYDLFVYWQERNALDMKHHKDYLDSKADLIEHRKKCVKCGFLEEYNPT